MNYELIDELLKDMGMSRRQLAIKAGLSENTMSGLFRRRAKNPSINTCQSIADALGIPVEMLMKTTDEIINDLEKKKTAAIQLPAISSSTIIQDAIKRQNYKPKISHSQVLTLFDSLNDSGKQKAVEILDILSRVPDFKKGV